MPNRLRKIFTLVLLATVIAALLPAPVPAMAGGGYGLYHDSHDSLYRTPPGAVTTNTEVTLRLRALADPIDSATLVLYDWRDAAETALPMTVVAITPDRYAYWEVTFETGKETNLYFYRFVVTAGDEVYYYEDDNRNFDDDTYYPAREGGPGTLYFESPGQSWQITVYDPDYTTPKWMRNAVVYQIFPDRFRNGDPANDPADDSLTFYDGLTSIFHETWNEPPVDPRQPGEYQNRWNVDFFGGDLAGITEELDYLQDLGVTAIYLNPIFAARSNHRYDTADYKMIDPLLGTQEDFATLVAEAKQRGIVLILDGVFNHMSSDSPYFDRYGRYEEIGACESLDSPYRNWFFFVPPSDQQPSVCVDTPTGATFYESWAGFDSIPRINNTRPEPRLYFYTGRNSVVATWGRAGIGGWRLDVGGDIDAGGPASDFWEGFRVAVRNANPEGVIIGEEWGNASPWLLGAEWDSVTNYRLRRGILGFVIDTNYYDNDANGDNVIHALTPTELDTLIRDLESDYPPMAYHAMMNILDSHDTSRLSFVAGTDAAQKLAALLQFTLPGAPTIYYGDEIGLDAPSVDDNGTLQDDPYNRAPYPWPDADGDAYGPPDQDMLGYYQTLSGLRQANPALREGRMVSLLANDETGVYAFLRVDTAAGNAALVVVNQSDDTQAFSVDMTGLIPDNIQLESTFTRGGLSVVDGQADGQIAANSGEVWTFRRHAAFKAPRPPENVAVRGENGRVILSWDGIPGAAGYAILRSPVATGGFVPVARTAVTKGYVDETVTNGFKYYYAVASITSDGLVGEPSAGLPAIPTAPITAVAYRMDDAPASIMLAYGAAATVRAVVTVDGQTGQEDAAPGVRAEAALIPADDDLMGAAWQSMMYAGSVDGGDAYETNLPLAEPGNFVQVVRFSTNAGESWLVATLDDGTFPPLTVGANDDVIAPEAPASAGILQASLAGVIVVWQDSPSDDVAAYRVYRTSDGETRLVSEVAAGQENRFHDKRVTQGQAYEYAVVAVDDALNESESVSTGEARVQRRRIPVTFVVTVPDYTSQGEGDVYIAGDLGAEELPFWNPGGVVMEQVDERHWTVTLDLPEGANIQYKYVRGTWEAVEKGVDCEEIANRTLTVEVDEGQEGILKDDDIIAKWRDLDSCP